MILNHEKSHAMEIATSVTTNNHNIPTILRFIAITLIVFGHFGAFEYGGGGAALLMMIVG